MWMKTLRYRYKYSCLVVVVVLTLTLAVGADSRSKTTGMPIRVSGLSVTKAQACSLRDARICHVRHVLIQRLEQVLSGVRQRDFADWAHSTKGGLAVVAMHGREVDLDTMLATPTRFIPTNDSVFSHDKLDLDLVPVDNLPGLYPGKALHLIDSRPPNIRELLMRSIRLGINFTPVMSTCLLALVFPTFREGIWYKLVASCLSASGPAFIKWGQWASTRSDLFPETLCQELAQLHSAAPSHSWSHTQEMMESSLGLPRGSLLDVFESFTVQPLASGSIAQVHKAVLKPQGAHAGTVVAVKVRHPNVARLIDMDFRLMKIAATIADYIPALSWLHIRDSVEQFSHTMAAQAHLNVEGHHLEVLNHNFRNWKHVKFPRPIYASSSIIIETFEPGRIVTEVLDTYDAMVNEHTAGEYGTLTVEEMHDENNGTVQDGIPAVPPDIAKFIVTNGLALYLKMLLVDNLMHADLHPGNIMLELNDQPISINGAKRSSSRHNLPKNNALVTSRKLGICLVDAGMVAQLTEQESTNFVGLLCSLGEGNGRLAAEFALRFSIESKLSKDERLAFINDMDELFKVRCGGYGANVDVGHVLRGVLGLVRKHEVRIDANYATLVVNCLCVESLAKRVCPSYNLLDAARPLLQTYQGLCYERNGKINESPSGVQKAIVQLRMPLAYLLKGLSDTDFFRKSERRAHCLRLT